MSDRATILTAFALTVAATPMMAQSAPRCFERGVLVETLQQKYSESLAGGGVQSATQLLEIWSSTESGTFTVIITRADGTSCVIAAGQNWQTANRVEVEGIPG